MLVSSVEKVKEEDLGMEGVKRTTIQWLLAQEEGARYFYMRRVILRPGGLVPLHKHPQEHEIYVLEGSGQASAGGQAARLTPGTFLFVPGGEEHEFRNEGPQNLVLLCCINRPEEEKG